MEINWKFFRIKLNNKNEKLYYIKKFNCILHELAIYNMETNRCYLITKKGLHREGFARLKEL